MIFLLHGATVSSAWGSSIDLRVEQAYYADIDNDGYEDDVLVKLKFEFLIDDDVDEIEFRYAIVLTLPSGIAHTYYVYLTIEIENDGYDWYNWYDNDWYDDNTEVIVNIDNLFYNHATELGDYRVDVYATLLEPDYDRTYASLIFDPPGADDGSEPEFDIVVY